MAATAGSSQLNRCQALVSSATTRTRSRSSSCTPGQALRLCDSSEKLCCGTAGSERRDAGSPGSMSEAVRRSAADASVTSAGCGGTALKAPCSSTAVPRTWLSFLRNAGVPRRACSSAAEIADFAGGGADGLPPARTRFHHDKPALPSFSTAERPDSETETALLPALGDCGSTTAASVPLRPSATAERVERLGDAIVGNGRATSTGCWRSATHPLSTGLEWGLCAIDFSAVAARYRSFEHSRHDYRSGLPGVLGLQSADSAPDSHKIRRHPGGHDIPGCSQL